MPDRGRNDERAVPSLVPRSQGGRLELDGAVERDHGGDHVGRQQRADLPRSLPAHRTLSDLVTEVEFVNGRGELQVVSDPELLAAAAGCFGLLGVVTALTLKLEPMSYAVLRPEKP